MSKRYKIGVGSYVGRFLPLKGSGGTGLGISGGGTGHCPCHRRAENCPAAAKQWQHVYLLGPGGKYVHAQILCIFPANLHGGFLHLTDLLEQPVLLPGALAAQPLHPDFSLHFRPPSPKDILPSSQWLCGPPRCISGQQCPGSPAATCFFPCILPTTLDPLPVLNLFCPKLQLYFSASFLYLVTSSSSSSSST